MEVIPLAANLLASSSVMPSIESSDSSGEPDNSLPEERAIVSNLSFALFLSSSTISSSNSSIASNSSLGT